MAGHFLAQIVGNVGRAPEFRMAGNTAIAKFGVPTETGYGEKKKTTWANCTAFGKTAEFVNNHFKKGTSVFVVGNVVESEYEANGNSVKKVEVLVSSANFGPSAPRTENAFVAADGGLEDVPF